MTRNLAYEFEDELELAARPRIRVRHIRGPYGESEIESFDPSPPAPGTILLTHYPFGGSNPSAAHRATIAKVAALAISKMSDAPNTLYCVVIDIEGHEDEVGDPGHFGEVGLDRAKKVVPLLVAQLKARAAKLPAASRRDVTINVSTAGPARPIRSNVTEAGRAMNRRVEIRVSVAPCGPIA
jgi:hypothetical protein